MSYLNGVHETYVAKALGLERYRSWWPSCPCTCRHGFVADRLRTRVEPVLAADAAHGSGHCNIDGSAVPLAA